MTYGFFLIFASCVTGQGPTTADNSLSVGAVLDRWESGAKLIESYDLAIELESQSLTVHKDGVYRLLQPSDNYPPITHYSHIARKGDKRFGEFGGDGKGHHVMTLRYDGEILAITMMGRNEYVIQKEASVFGAVEYEDYEATYRTILGTADRIAMSRARNARLLAREGSAYVVSVPDVKDGSYSILSWKFWLDPTKNFMPIRWTQSVVKEGRELRDRDCVVTLKEVAEGVWAPVAATISVYNKDETLPIFGKISGVDRLSVVLDKSRFNGPIQDSVFEVKIPNGATVVDRTRNVVYNQGSSDPDGYLARLALEGKQSLKDLPKSNRELPLIFVPNQSGSWSSSKIVVAGVVILVAGGFTAIGLRRIGRRRA